MVGTGNFSVSCSVNFMTSGFLYTSQSTFSFFISALCRENCTFFKNDRKMHSFGAFWLLSLCYYVIKYLMRDMMNYHCLRVLRSRVRRIGIFLCSEPECMAIPMLSWAVFRSRAPSLRFFFLAVSISHTLSLIHIWRCRRAAACRSRWSPYH